MGLFNKKKKEKQPELKKLELKFNGSMVEYRCPYCNYVLGKSHPNLIDKNMPEINYCPDCSKEFLK